MDIARSPDVEHNLQECRGEDVVPLTHMLNSKIKYTIEIANWAGELTCVATSTVNDVTERSSTDWKSTKTACLVCKDPLFLKLEGGR